MYNQNELDNSKWIQFFQHCDNYFQEKHFNDVHYIGNYKKKLLEITKYSPVNYVYYEPSLLNLGQHTFYYPSMVSDPPSPPPPLPPQSTELGVPQCRCAVREREGGRERSYSSRGLMQPRADRGWRRAGRRASARRK